MFQFLLSALAEIHAEFLGRAPPDDPVFPHWMGIPLSFVFMVGIVWAYKGHGLKGTSILMLYITGLITVQLTMKSVLQHFPYPLFISSLHFIGSLTGVYTFLAITGEEHPNVELSCPKYQKWYYKNVVPTCICQYLAISLNNVSLIYIGAGINAMIGLATPVVTALVAACFGMKIAALAWVGVLFTVGGDAVITLDGFGISVAEGQSLTYFVYGAGLSIFSMFTRGAKTVLQDKLMNNYGNDEEYKSFTPLQSVALQGPLLIILALVGSLTNEGMAPWRSLPAALMSPAACTLIVNVLAATCLQISAAFCIKMLGAPAAQIAGKLNVLVVAALSCALLGETLTLKQGASTLLIIGGAALYEKAQRNNIQDLDGLIAHMKNEASLKYDATV